jgi:adenylate cyclase
MAVEMRRRLNELNGKWQRAGTNHQFRARIGINTGFCKVGNFGSADRMEYTIIGAEANLAARLQAIAEPGDIVVSFETYALVRDIVAARKLSPITMKGINREIIPYAVERILDTSGETPPIFSEHLAGLYLDLDPNVVNAGDAERIKAVLRAVTALDRKFAPPP